MFLHKGRKAESVPYSYENLKPTGCLMHNHQLLWRTQTLPPFWQFSNYTTKLHNSWRKLPLTIPSRKHTSWNGFIQFCQSLYYESSDLALTLNFSMIIIRTSLKKILQNTMISKRIYPNSKQENATGANQGKMRTSPVMIIANYFVPWMDKPNCAFHCIMSSIIIIITTWTALSCQQYCAQCLGIYNFLLHFIFQVVFFLFYSSFDILTLSEWTFVMFSRLI